MKRVGIMHFVWRLIGVVVLCSLSWAHADAPQPLPLLTTAGQVTANASLTLAPKIGVWNLAHYDSLYLNLRNPSAQTVTVWARAENSAAAGATDNCRTAVTLEPGQTETMRLRIMRRPEDPTYAPLKPFFMYYKNINVRDNTVDPTSIARVVVWLDHPVPGLNVLVQSVTAQGEGVAGPVPFFPFVDKYGQYLHTDWPDKIYTDADFAARLQKDKAEMSVHPGPPDWDQWGGWKSGPKQKATGFFYPLKVSDKWWLVDPGGNLFWSYGATGVGSGGEGSPVTGKENWFAELPSPDGPFAKYWGQGKGARYMYYSDGKPWRSFSFSGANAERKYGPNWRETTADSLHSRLRNWGLNTMGNWSDPTVYLRHKTPYCVAMNSGGPQLEHIPDVFDPEFSRATDANMERERGTTAGDPWCIGYFVDNELTWGWMGKAEIAIRGALRAASTSATKQTLLADLKAKYTDIAALNTSWGTDYASWDAMLQGRELPDAKNAAARSEDLGAFGLKFAEKYFSTVRDAVKRVAPNNLYLGCRFNGNIDKSLMQIAAKYCDVLSYNIYEEPNGRLNQYRGVVDKPFIVGEFGTTSDLTQMPWRGQVYTEDEGARLRPMEKYLGQAFVHPALVGAHFFQFRDQPLTGRGDGEATLRGFINTADTPHFDLVQLNRRLAYNLYKTRSTGHVPAPVPQPIHGMIGVGTWGTQAEFKDIKVTRGAQTLFAGDFTKGIQGWKTSRGQWKIVDGALRQTTNEEDTRAFIGDPDWSDYTLTLKARKLGGKEGFLILFGSPGDDTKTWWNLGGWGNTKFGLELPGLTSTPLPGQIETGRWYDIRLELQGTGIKVYLDGKLVQQAVR